MKEVGVKRPTRPAPATGEVTIDPLDMEVYQKEVKSYMHNKELLQASTMKIYSVIYGHCSDGILSKIDTMSNHEMIANDGDTIGPLKNIKSVMANLQIFTKPV